MSQMVSVNELKIGMYVQLDVSWMDHPFPRSAFRLESAEQIQTIRRLGLQQIRWDPARSAVDAVAPAEPSLAGPDAPVAAADSGPAAGCAVAPAIPDARAARRRALQRQRGAERLCQAQYEEAGRALHDALGRVRAQPQAARVAIEALSRAMSDKMLGQGEICVRVLNAAAGDRATAHSMNVAVVAMLLGRRLGLTGSEVAQLGTGALLHDLGKLDLPQALRHADQRMGAAEQSAYQSHVELGLRQAQRMGADPTVLAIIGQHHEFANGSGFPHRLAGDAIAAAARIVALVNRFDSLCNPPVLTQALTPHEALSSLFVNQRACYDATVLQAFIRMMGVYPAGSLVQLTDERYAMVVSVDADRPLKPRVLVHDPDVPRDEALHLDLQSAGDLGIRRSLRAAQLPPQALAYLSPRPRVSYYFEPLSPASADPEEVAV